MLITTTENTYCVLMPCCVQYFGSSNDSSHCESFRNYRSFHNTSFTAYKRPRRWTGQVSSQCSERRRALLEAAGGCRARPQSCLYVGSNPCLHQPPSFSSNHVYLFTEASYCVLAHIFLCAWHIAGTQEMPDRWMLNLLKMGHSK